MITREAQLEIAQLLEEFPAVAVLGPRQVGKTTLAETIANSFSPDPVYLDLESPTDQAKLREPEAYFELHKGQLIILDEIQRVPELFAILRGVIDRRRRQGYKTGQFLILGSASLDLLKQASESLAGRIAYKELSGLTATEIISPKTGDQNRLWLRGGLPDSFLANTDPASLRWRLNFISTYLERDVPQFGPRIPATTLRLLWTMLAHNQGAQLNLAQLGASLGISIPTTKRYIELLEDLLLIRHLRPWSGNIGKRLVKAPKVYIRDSGITHALLNLTNLDDLLGHPVVGASWEGFVVENLLSCLPVGATPWFYRTSAGAEIDLVIERNSQQKYAIEIKRSMAPALSKGFYLGCEDIGATNRFLVYPGTERYPISKDVTAISLVDMMQELRKIQ
ncbi:ATP-binding protein [Spirosoma sp. BT702]|uniref:ATP-binding protein n=1 Tax=Spirosoma profusum TaxID=2771354 RepID=A0A926Y5J5_9BACT|nr:ATP-binding protein [Spirosoma profusum]MBD2704676.1 ATP-binding protein [Spirosoma profusum]